MKTKKILLSMLTLGFVAGSFAFSAPVIDSQIWDALDKKIEQEMIKNAQDLNEKITFTKVNSCESMETVMSDFLETYKKLNPRERRNWRWVMESDFVAINIKGMATNDVVQSLDTISSDTSAVIDDYSTTNTQKIWVDEPEILKSNGKYLFYYSEPRYNDSYISIIKTPTKSDLSDAELITKIEIPSSLYDIQLFLNWDKLIILWSRYASSYNSVLWNARSIVIIYDISDLNNLKLEKLTEVYGYFEDARMIKDQLYLISSINLNWYDIARRDEPIIFTDMQPRITDIVLKKSINKAEWLINSYQKKISKIPCNKIFYLLPSEDTMKETGIYPNFTLVSQISISDLDATTQQNLVFGNVNEIHMSQSSLYLPSPVYFSNPIRCSIWWCYDGRYYRDENTLIHKFNLWKSVVYQDSTIIPWEPLNQYSMDEDDDGNFRILTTTRYDQKATHLSILDKDLKLKGNLMNIEPGENFKSSRYIWDKLYLVTFQDIDPLFVVDIENISNPKIIWELKIPWYSTYLHPYAEAKNWIQYLIWLGYSVADNWYWWLTNDNVKVDLYKIDYNSHETADTKCSSLITKNVKAELTDSCSKSTNTKTCNQEQKAYEDCLKKVNPENIAVSLIASHEFDWDSSYSPALHNPRLFVRRSAKQELILPVQITNIIEKWSTQNKRRSKYESFVGIKWLSIKSSTALIKEFLSQTFTDSEHYLNAESARVGYVNDIYYFLNEWLVGFLTKEGKIATIWEVN